MMPAAATSPQAAVGGPRGEIRGSQRAAEGGDYGRNLTGLVEPPTSRELEDLKLVAEGLSQAQIAERLFLSEVTVEQRLRIAYKLLGVKNRVQAAALYRQGGRNRGQ
jgi:DNA-binding NarL/FixJ family response regulator